MATTRTFTREQFEDWEFPYDAPPGGKIISKEITETKRWSVVKEITFTLPDQEPGTAWQVDAYYPATEMQEGQDLWNEDKEITATLVREVEKTVKVWEPA